MTCCQPMREPRPTGRTAANNATVRTVFVVGPDKKIKLMLAYPMTTGRNFDEVLRGLDSMQLTATHKVATPVNWKRGEDVIIASAVSDETPCSMNLSLCGSAEAPGSATVRSMRRPRRARHPRRRRRLS